MRRDHGILRPLEHGVDLQKVLKAKAEAAALTHDTALTRETRLRLWSEHLELPIEQVAGEPAQVIDDYWKPISKEQLARREAGEPLTHRLVRFPHLSRRSERLLDPLQGLLLDG